MTDYLHNSLCLCVSVFRYLCFGKIQLFGGGEIIREMALGKKAMDLGVLFCGAKYAVECKKVAFYEKSHEKAYDQICGYMDRLGVGEGWLVVFDPDLSKPWDGKIFAEDVPWHGKTVHLVGC